MSAERRGSLERRLAVAALVLAGLLFWKLRILDSGVDPKLSAYGGDLYLQHWPMAEYGFGVLRSGHLPLWNPYQLCGLPFLPIPYVGLFYPLNVVYLLFPTPLAIELDTVLHTLLGLIGMWALMRHYGSSPLAAATAACTFAWSGWLIYSVNQPSIFANLSWMPLTVLALDAVACGSRWAWLGLSLTVALPLLRGGAEVLVHSLLAAALFGGARLAALAITGETRKALGRALWIAVSIAAGAGLAAIQLVPTFELLGASARNAGIPYELARLGSLTVPEILQATLDGLPRAPMVTVGMLPLLALIIAPSLRQRRKLWLCAVALLVLSLALIPGGVGFRLYHGLPVVGPMFRRPFKLLSFYSLALAILTGLAIGKLEEWTARTPAEVRRQLPWIAALGGGVALLALWPWSGFVPPASLALLLVLLASLGVLRATKLRPAIVAALCLTQAASLFAMVSNTQMRPLRRPDTFSVFETPLSPLRQRPAYERTLLFADFGSPVGWNAKLGMLNRFGSMTDFEALVPTRYGDFFSYVTTSWSMIENFVGLYSVGPTAGWRLLDLTGLRYFASLRGSSSDTLVATGIVPPGTPPPRLVDDGPVRIYERSGALPRASFVPIARVIARPAAALRYLRSETFNPAREVVLEEAPDQALSAPRVPREATAVIRTYEPERVTVEVSSDQPGFLVLSDLFYPGWKAFADDAEVPIQRANYLFRAVGLPAGRHQVRFEYQADTFHRGLLVTAVTALALLVIAVGLRLRKRAVTRERHDTAEPWPIDEAIV